MIQASKFVFFNCSHPKKMGENWTRTVMSHYLMGCGVGSKAAGEIYQASVIAREQGNISYEAKESIGNFQFPPAWLGTLDLKGFIEAVMHQIGQGIAGDVLDLSSSWLTESKAKGYAKNTFRKHLQPLLQTLKLFQLSWLKAYSFSAGEGQLETGSWVGENWLAFIRISPVAYAWFCRDLELTQPHGVMDVLRLVRSFYCLTAWIMMHAGIDQDFIDETALYVKEFLSCVWELDIRL
jgi:hypothetical protein